MIIKILRKLKECVEYRRFEFEEEFEKIKNNDYQRIVLSFDSFREIYHYDIEEVMNELNLTKDEWNERIEEDEIIYKYKEMVFKLSTEIAKELGLKWWFTNDNVCIIYKEQEEIE